MKVMKTIEELENEIENLNLGLKNLKCDNAYLISELRHYKNRYYALDNIIDIYIKENKKLKEKLKVIKNESKAKIY